MIAGKRLISSLLASLACFGFPHSICSETELPPPAHNGRILFLIQQGEHEQALKLYQAFYQEKGQHDFELLHQIGLRILDYGFRQNDPRCQLLALFGASVSAHEDAYYILEESLKSRIPEIQLIALDALGRFQTDKADQAMIRALGSPQLQVRYEAARQLCKKKHPQAVIQTESLMYKSPAEFLPVYPSLFAMVGDSHSTRVLRKLLTHSSNNVRLAVVLSAAKYGRDDLLPQLRQQAAHHQFAIQEACAYAMGILKDEEGIPQLEKLTLSQYPTVALAAHIALFRLGRKEALDAIENAGRQHDVFAIAVLGAITERSDLLLKLIESENLQIRINALNSLLEQNHPIAMELIAEMILRDKRDLAFTATESPGKTLKAWKATTSSSRLLKDDLSAYQENLDLKESLLQKVRLHSELHFIAIANQIFASQQNELIPATIELLIDLNSKDAVNCLKQHQQQLGAPLVRQYCNLALYRLNEPGPYGEQLRQWIRTQNNTEFIQLKPFIPWEYGENSYALKPAESSRLLIEAFEAFASNQDSLGIETLIEALATEHSKKYALAGLLLRATQ